MMIGTFRGTFNGSDCDISKNPQGYIDALLVASNTGGYLASISSQQENDFSRDNVIQGESWFGFHHNTLSPDYNEPHGGRLWQSGESVTDTNWSNRRTLYHNRCNNNATEDQCTCVIRHGSME